MGENGLLDLAERGAGFDAQLGGQHDACPAVGGECIGRPPGSIERPHQQAPGPLPVRIGLHERFELSDAGLPAPTGQLSLDPVFHQRRPQLLQAGDLTCRQRFLLHTLIWLAVERGTRLSQQFDGPLRIPGAHRFTALDDSCGDSGGVDHDNLGIEQIATTAFDDRRRSDGASQPYDFPLQRLARRRRRTVRPQRLRQHLHGHPLTQA